MNTLIFTAHPHMSSTLITYYTVPAPSFGQPAAAPTAFGAPPG